MSLTLDDLISRLNEVKNLPGITGNEIIFNMDYSFGAHVEEVANNINIFQDKRGRLGMYLDDTKF